MSEPDNAQPPSQYTLSDAPLEAPQIEDATKPKRKPNEPKDAILNRMVDMGKTATSSNSHETIATTMEILRGQQHTPEPVKKPRNVANEEPKPISHEPPMQDTN